jgi:uncharacterized membrane protein YedE/YeeE
VLFYLALGIVFGFVLSRSGAADYNYIQGMFLFERFQLYGIIGAAVVFTAPGLWMIKRYGRTASGVRISVARKSLNAGTVFGSVLFGVGWSMTGLCPGPIFVNLGEGKFAALAALAGALTGAAAFGTLFPRIQRLFGLPRIDADRAPAAADALKGFVPS